MADQVRRILEELLRFRQSPQDDTAAFRHLRHNDHLCPAFERQINRYLDCFIKYQRVAYDVQGPRDRGTDLLLRYTADEEDRYIALQVKSYDDLKEREYLSRLKAQMFEVHGEFGSRLAHCYVVLCTDQREHRNQLRNIKKDLSTISWATVVDPTYAWTFHQLSDLHVEAVVEALLKEQDAVYGEARRMIVTLAPLDVAVLLSVVWLARSTQSTQLRLEQLAELGFLTRALRCIPDVARSAFFAEEGNLSASHHPDLQRSAELRLAESLEVLSDGVVFTGGESGVSGINLADAEPIEALMLDAKVRFAYDADQLLRYLFNALDVPRTYGIDLDAE